MMLRRFFKTSKLLLPAMSPTMESGSIAKWHKKPGDLVKANEVLFSIETDKATVDVEATDEMVLAKYLVDPGKLVKVGTPIALWVDRGEDWKAAATSAKEEQSEEKKSDEKVTANNKVQQRRQLKFPSVAHILAGTGIEMKDIKGSGKRGQVLKGDAIKAVAARGPQKKAAAAPTPSPSPAPAPVASSSSSGKGAPHFYVYADCHVEEADALLGPSAPPAQWVAAAARAALPSFSFLGLASAQVVPLQNSSSVASSLAVLDWGSLGLGPAAAILAPNQKALFSVGALVRSKDEHGKPSAVLPLCFVCDARQLSEDQASQFVSIVQQKLSLPALFV